MTVIEIESKAWKDLIQQIAGELGIQVEPASLDLFGAHAQELIRWNQKVNLTAITDPVEVAIKHIVDSLLPAPYFKSTQTVLDMGTGGGFPGLVLKCHLMNLSMLLIDSNRKKVNFLKYMIRLFNLKDIDAQQARVESLSHFPKFDVVISRAAFALDRFIDMAMPLLSPTGTIIAMKGKSMEENRAVLKKLEQQGMFDIEVQDYMLPKVDQKRYIIRIQRKS